jgi:cell division protease FtsH
VHTCSVPLAPDVDLGGLAATTAGMVGADLANLVNEAALIAACREQVTMSDFSDSLEKDRPRRGAQDHAERRRPATDRNHEAGHASVGMLSAGADPVRKISIIPRSRSLGVTLSAPESDQFNYDEQGLLVRIRVATGGRAAEEVVYGDQTTGAESDIRQAIQLARQKVGRFGMSEEIGFVAVLPQDGEASALQGLTEVSEQTRQRVDAEVKRIVGEAHDEAIRLLTEHRERLD